jgi:Holliday junction resolvasome RuvABC endonuclease subunit
MKLKLKTANTCSPLSIGIDASLTGTAVSVIECKTGKLLHIEVIKSKKRKVARLQEIQDSVDRIISIPLLRYGHHTFTRVFYEGYAYGFGKKQNSSSITGLAELRGVLTTMIIRRFKLPIYFVAPMTLKKAITGKGVGDKNLVILAAYKKWHREFADDNECDSFGLAMIGHMIYNKSKTLQKYEVEVIKTINESDQHIDAEGN